MGWPALSSDSVGWRWLLEGKDQPMKIAILGIDLGKNSCSVVGLDHAHATGEHPRLHPDDADLHRRDGGLLRCASFRPTAEIAGTHGAVDISGIRSPPMA